MRYTKKDHQKKRYNFERLVELRKDSGLKQTELAKILNMSQRNYSHIECGDYDIPSEILVKLCLFYRVSADYILGITNERKPYQQNSELTTKRVYPTNE